MPRGYGAEVHETTPHTSFDAGNDVDERFLHSELGDEQPEGEYQDSAPEYPTASSKNPDNRWTES